MQLGRLFAANRYTANLSSNDPPPMWVQIADVDCTDHVEMVPRFFFVVVDYTTPISGKLMFYPLWIWYIFGRLLAARADI